MYIHRYMYIHIARSIYLSLSLSLALSRSLSLSLSLLVRTMSRGHRHIAADAGLGTLEHPMWSDSIRCSSKLGVRPVRGVLVTFPPWAGEKSSDLWMFDPVRVEWTDLSALAAAQGSTPPARSQHGMASADGRIVMFGGAGKHPAS